MAQNAQQRVESLANGCDLLRASSVALLASVFTALLAAGKLEFGSQLGPGCAPWLEYAGNKVVAAAANDE